MAHNGVIVALILCLALGIGAVHTSSATSTFTHPSFGVCHINRLSSPVQWGLRLRGGGNALGVDGDAITEEQAGEELIKAATSGDVHGLDPPGIEYLIQAGAPVNYQDMWRRTPLHYAAREGHVSAIMRIAELGGDLTSEDFLARTPLHMAARKGHVQAVEALVKLGSNINHPDKNPWPNNGGRTPLHWACYKGHADIAAKLCELGADKEALDLMQRTPLHWAARRGQADCVQVLLYMGADVHAVDKKALKPLNLANSKESNAATQALLHAATIRGNLPTSLPNFPPRPIPQPVPRAPTTKPKAVAPPRKAPVPAAAGGASTAVSSAAAVGGGGKAVRGKEQPPSLQEAIAQAKAKAHGMAPSAAAAASSVPPAAGGTQWGEQRGVGGNGLEDAVAQARARLAQQHDDEEEWDTQPQPDFPTGAVLDSHAKGDGWGQEAGNKKGYSLKAQGVVDDGTRFVREDTLKTWQDDDEDADVEYA